MMKVEELLEIIKPIKNVNNLYFTNNTIKFSYENATVHGTVDIETNFDKNFMLAYIDNLYKILNDKKILKNEIIINDDHITDSKKSFEYPLYEYEDINLVISKPDNLLPELDLSTNLKYEELIFEKSGTYIKSKSRCYKKRINENKHNCYASISYSKKLEYLPKKTYEYIIGIQELTLKLTDKYTYYFNVSLDSISDEETDSEIDAYLQDL